MPADTIFFFNDLLNINETARSLTASGTAAGYAIDHVRDPNLLTAWKGVDSTTADIWLQADGGSTSWIGAAGETAYMALAYDSRDNEQDSLNLNTDNADNPAMSAQTTAVSFTLSKQTQAAGGVKIQWKSFAIPGTAKRYYRLLGPGGARSEASGSKVPKIYSWAMFDKDTVYPMSTAFPQDAPGPGGLSVLHRVGLGRTAGYINTNKYAASGQQFDVVLRPASKLMWETLRDKLMDQDGPSRAMYMQYEGTRNTDQANVFLCRFIQINWEARREFIDQYDVSLRFETEAWR